MEKILLIIFLLPIIVIAKTNQDSINNVVNQKIIELSKIKSEHDEIEKKLFDLKDKHDYQVKQNDQTLSSISSQIEAASFNVTIFGILFGIIALGVGLYITFIERKILALREDNKQLLKESLDAKNEVVLINNLIHEDINGLFLKIKREETVHILKRLINIPEDITNLSNELLSRELEETDYKLLKEAYLKLDYAPPSQYLQIDMPAKQKYLLLFFQHFTYQSIMDDEIKGDLINFFHTGIDCAFEVDIIKSTKEFVQAIMKLGFFKSNNEVENYFKKIADSKHQNCQKLYEAIFNTLGTRDNKFNFYNVLMNNNQSDIMCANYGKLLINEYQSEQLTDLEKSIIENINDILRELK